MLFDADNMIVTGVNTKLSHFLIWILKRSSKSTFCSHQPEPVFFTWWHLKTSRDKSWKHVVIQQINSENIIWVWRSQPSTKLRLKQSALEKSKLQPDGEFDSCFASSFESWSYEANTCSMNSCTIPKCVRSADAPGVTEREDSLYGNFFITE